MIELLIAQACSGLVGNQHDACVAALDKTATQCEVKGDVSKIETYVSQRAFTTVESVVDKKIIGAVGLTAKVIRDRSIRQRVVKNSGLVPEISTTAGQNGGSIDFSWHF